jgi:hypothetical protein
MESADVDQGGVGYGGGACEQYTWTSALDISLSAMNWINPKRF